MTIIVIATRTNHMRVSKVYNGGGGVAIMTIIVIATRTNHMRVSKVYNGGGEQGGRLPPPPRHKEENNCLHILIGMGGGTLSVDNEVGWAPIVCRQWRSPPTLLSIGSFRRPST